MREVAAINKPKIFISHIHEEATLGGVLKAWIEDAFPGQLTVFLSSDPKDLSGGSKWLEVVRSQLKDDSLKILIALISPNSLSRPWISIELGAAWILDRAVIPFCHSGTKKGSLPRPLGDFVAIELGNGSSAKLLMDAISAELGLKYSSRLHLKQMEEEMLAASSHHESTDSGVVVVDSSPAPVPVLDGEEVRILQLLCAAKDGNGDGNVLIADLAQHARLPLAKLEWRMKSLMNGDFARGSYSGRGRYFSIKEKGTALLVTLNMYPGA